MKRTFHSSGEPWRPCPLMTSGGVSHGRAAYGRQRSPATNIMANNG